MKVNEIKFVGIDSWNRPVFKDVCGNHYGSTNTLYSHHENIFDDEAKLQRVLKELVFFGSRFNCEPMGTPFKNEFILKQ